MFPVAIFVVDDASELTLNVGVYERVCIRRICKILRACRMTSDTWWSEENWRFCATGPAGIATGVMDKRVEERITEAIESRS